ncbi:energy transducer TonB family protein [Thiobacillus denitrificans]|nr:energy transducer TonB [Thiobacillus denitrificans]
MPPVSYRLLLALALSLGAHTSLLVLGKVQAVPPPPAATEEPLRVDLTLVPAQPVKPARPAPATPRLETKPTKPVHAPEMPSPPADEKTPAELAAPPAPTAEEWALASTYTPKNSKRYRYAWGQQVRSMMGTAIEGERQGMVRLRIEIAPDGKLVKADVLWSTSEIAETLALQAIRSMPSLPRTPTGKPLVFEKTISLMPFETGWPPIYKYDCLPDPPSFSNRFAWDGSSPQPASRAPRENTAASREAAPTECPDAGPDSIEAEEKDMERQFKEWGSLGE